ncbi:uncharacterized protein [Nerophis lumbriciformis]|uniref:uncharacterized protein n=1 Tax=Nerophis lumbriciformis TaxID=546530 RepID=UPI003BA9B194
MLKELVKERLMAAADEIFALFERTITSYEEELSRTRKEKERHRQQLEAARKAQIVLHVEDVQQLSGRQEERLPTPQEGSSTLKQEDPQPPHIKEEEEELWISQSGEECLLGPQEADLTRLPLTGVSVKTVDHENKPQVDHLLAPLSDSDNITSQYTMDGDKDYIQEPLRSDTDSEGDMRTHTDNKHPERSEKKTGKKGFTCSFCDKSFCSKTNFARHIRTHTGEKPFNCSVCGNTFSYKATWTAHMRTHTGETPFNCSVCGNTFSYKATWTAHMRTHTGEKPFKCSVCGDHFSQKGTLTAHMRIHTGEKPFICSVCGDKFSRRFSLKLHTRTHTGEKPFSCPVCGDKFSWRSSLSLHIKKHRIKTF